MNPIDHHRDEERRQARREYLTEQVELLLAGEDADEVKFFSGRKGRILWMEGFADKLAEELAGIDRGAECWVVQCLLAVGRGEDEKAKAIYDLYLHDKIVAVAEQMISEAME